MKFLLILSALIFIHVESAPTSSVRITNNSFGDLITVGINVEGEINVDIEQEIINVLIKYFDEEDPLSESRWETAQEMKAKRSEEAIDILDILPHIPELSKTMQLSAKQSEPLKKLIEAFRSRFAQFS